MVRFSKYVVMLIFLVRDVIISDTNFVVKLCPYLTQENI